MESGRRSQYLKEIDFDNWANKRYLHFLDEKLIEEERIYKIFSHIFSAQILWINRIQPDTIKSFNLWEVYPLDVMEEMCNLSYNAWNSFISNHSDTAFESIISYTNTQGLSFETPLHEIIRHVLHHGTYHRGQLALLIRDLGFTPPYTDYVAFIRNQ